MIQSTAWKIVSVLHFTVHLYGLTGSVDIWACWRREIKLESRGSLGMTDVMGHLQPPMLQAICCKSARGICTRAWPHVHCTHTSIQNSFSRIVIHYFFSFSYSCTQTPSKWSSRTESKLMINSSGMRLAEIFFPYSLTQSTCWGIN